MNESGGRRDEEGIYIQTPGDSGKQFVFKENPRSWGLTSRGLATYKEDPPSIFLISGEKRQMVITPMPSGPSLVLFLTKPVPTQTLCDEITDAVRRLEKIFHSKKKTLLQDKNL